MAALKNNYQKIISSKYLNTAEAKKLGSEYQRI